MLHTHHCADLVDAVAAGIHDNVAVNGTFFSVYGPGVVLVLRKGGHRRVAIDFCTSFASPARQGLTQLRGIDIAVFSVPVIAFVKKMTGQLANGPKVVAGTGYGGKDGSYTKDEVSKHKTQDDLWLIIDGAVYDVTEYVDEHPGGVAAIMKNAGGDASEGFHGPQHPSRVMDIVDEYKIGTLVEAAKDK